MIRGVFHEPPGIDFSRAVASGLRRRLGHAPPEALARVTLLVNTQRMARRIEAAFAEAGATVLPRIGLVSDIAALLPPGAAPVPTIGPLALRLRLARLTEALLHAHPDLAPPAAGFDLACSLADLLAEMQEEGVDIDALRAIETGELSEHWRRNLDFLEIVLPWLDGSGEVTAAAAQRRALDVLLDRWRRDPPRDPVLVAGSTASRAPTRALMAAVAGLPQGALILPGLDCDMPETDWQVLTGETHGPAGAQDHPQYRHAAMLGDLGMTRAELARWDDAPVAAPRRNALLSLALRPAPATDAWRAEGPALIGIAEACAEVTLLEAPDPVAEAATVALRLRAALEDGHRAALITPDRNLSRRVAAQLDRWGIEPDDSAGLPLNQSVPGRFLLLLADLSAPRLDAEALVALLKHPVTASGGDRRAHLDRTRALEMDVLRRKPVAFPDRTTLTQARATAADTPPPDAWDDWLHDLLDTLAPPAPAAPLGDQARVHFDLAERLAAGPDGPETGILWTGPAGRCAHQVVRDLCDCAPERGDDALPASDHARILHRMIAAEEVREARGPHPDVMIWGALEARVRTADLVILGGLVDGVWPDHPGADPWLNRAMRTAAGLRLPERATGLSAHDFQLAAAGPRIWLTRALRDDEAETVPSRWLNRLTGLLSGLDGEATAALDAMRARGAEWLARAAELSRPDARHPEAAAPRPAPKPPVGTTPATLPVTAIETLIRDPYAIYARYILGLRGLDPLRQTPDARLRGQLVHDAMERFARRHPEALGPEAADDLRGAMEDALKSGTPWPGAGRIWMGRFARMAPAFLADEAGRRTLGRPAGIEDKGTLTFADLPFTLTARADRIDLRADSVAIYDYKTGKAPGGPQQEAFAKQLILEALMVRRGGFPNLPRAVDEVAYLEVGTNYAVKRVTIEDGMLGTHETRLRELIARYRAGQPWIARLAPDLIQYAGDYDQLSRRGEWQDTQQATVIPVGRT